MVKKLFLRAKICFITNVKEYNLKKTQGANITSVFTLQFKKH